jgi:hypothetical protein
MPGRCCRAPVRCGWTGRPYDAGLQARYRHGFIYSDCRTDDARLVVANARDAARQGARILPRTELVAAQRVGGLWQVRLGNGETLAARAIANVAGPWVKEVLNARLGVPSTDSVRLVRGSHLVLPRLYDGRACLHPAERRPPRGVHDSLTRGASRCWAPPTWWSRATRCTRRRRTRRPTTCAPPPGAT